MSVGLRGGAGGKICGCSLLLLPLVVVVVLVVEEWNLELGEGERR